jgi:lipopolysaccharide transport system permease protein
MAGFSPSERLTIAVSKGTRGRASNLQGMALALARPRQRRDLVWELVARDVKLRYRRSVLGILWSQLAPLSMIAIFSFVFGHILPLKIPNYPAFLFVGLLAWIWFQTSLLAGTQSVTGSRDLVRQPGFPVPLLPVVAIGSGLINYLLALPVMLVWIGVTTGRVPLTAISLPAILAAQFLVVLGPAYILSAIQVTFRDIGHIVEIVLLPLFYATPIFYTHYPQRFHLVYDLNPLARLMTAYRSALLEGRWPNGGMLAIVSLIGAAVAVLGYFVFARRSRRFAEEL